MLASVNRPQLQLETSFYWFYWAHPTHTDQQNRRSRRCATVSRAVPILPLSHHQRSGGNSSSTLVSEPASVPEPGTCISPKAVLQLEQLATPSSLQQAWQETILPACLTAWNGLLQLAQQLHGQLAHQEAPTQQVEDVLLQLDGLLGTCQQVRSVNGHTRTWGEPTHTTSSFCTSSVHTAGMPLAVSYTLQLSCVIITLFRQGATCKPSSCRFPTPHTHACKTGTCRQQQQCVAGHCAVHRCYWCLAC